MTMPRPKGKAQKIAASVMKNKAGQKIVKTKKPQKMTELGPYLQH